MTGASSSVEVVVDSDCPKSCRNNKLWIPSQKRKIRMKKTLSLIAALAFLVAGTADAFTVDNHATVAYIAQQHMSHRALKNFQKAFDNHPLVEFASYPDFFRAIYKINGYQIGHSVNLDENMYPIPMKEGEKADAYNALVHAIEQLKDYRSLDDSTRYAAMGLLVHLMGDIHCPGHLKYADRRGDIKSICFKKYLNDDKEKPEVLRYHSFWDSWCTDMRYSHGFVERAMLFDISSKKQIREIQKGSLEDWTHASAVDCQNLFDVKEGQLVERVYVTRMAGEAARQVSKAGYRLAAIMNELFAR